MLGSCPIDTIRHAANRKEKGASEETCSMAISIILTRQCLLEVARTDEDSMEDRDDRDRPRRLKAPNHQAMKRRPF